jgi:3-oxoacyl-[acyl-carrier-protein] synthase-1
MAALAISECLRDVPDEDWPGIPLLLCVAEEDRLGRIDGLDDELLAEIQQDLGVEFKSGSTVIAHGRTSIGVALRRARELLATTPVSRVLIAATDTLVTWATISAYERNERLLTSRNSNGFMPGEGAGALLVGHPTGQPQLTCTGIGLATEPNHIGVEEPLRANGLTEAIKSALADAACAMHDLDFRVVDISGEQYYFKEAALAVSRLLRQPKAEFDIWHPAECIGESGATVGVAALVVMDAACRKNYACGHNILFHASNDGGQRTATVMQFR